MIYTWFAQVNDELDHLGIDRHKCGVRVIAEIRNCWLEDMTPAQTAQKIKNDFFG
jgi:hypothetical protein